MKVPNTWISRHAVQLIATVFVAGGLWYNLNTAVAQNAKANAAQDDKLETMQQILFVMQTQGAVITNALQNVVKQMDAAEKRNDDIHKGLTDSLGKIVDRLNK